MLPAQVFYTSNIVLGKKKNRCVNSKTSPGNPNKTTMHPLWLKGKQARTGVGAGTLLWLMEQSWKLSKAGAKYEPTEACTHGSVRVCARPRESMLCAAPAHSVPGSNQETTLVLQCVKGGKKLYLLQAVGRLLS